MAVEATHPNQAVPFPWPSIPDFVNPCNQGNVQQIRFSEIQSTAMLPLKHTVDAVLDSIPAKISVNTVESVQRKRSRDSMNHFYAAPNFLVSQIRNGVDSQFSSLFGDNLLPQIQQHQLEIDSIISHHTKIMRLEIEERQKQQAKLLVTAIGEKAIRKLREKDEQIQKMGKLNWALQERVKCLFMENQLWRDLAQTNEAQAHSLRADLEQALAHVGAQDRLSGDDVESCCGSNDDDVEGGGGLYGDRRCKRCGERESCVLVLPCRHMCLCNVCGSGSYHIQECPVCNSGMSGTLHVNMSP